MGNKKKKINWFVLYIGCKYYVVGFDKEFV